MSFYIKLAGRVERCLDPRLDPASFLQGGLRSSPGVERGEEGVLSGATTQYEYFAPSFHYRTVIGISLGLEPGSGSRTA